MFERGRLDHLGFTVTTVAALTTLRDRLVAVDASSGAIRRVGPMLSVRFHDPDEAEGEVNRLDPSYDPSTLRDEDDVVDPLWFARMAAILHAGQATDAGDLRDHPQARTAPVTTGAPSKGTDDATHH